ncbi:oxygen-dependent choline dehydrogenase-like [Sitodiplosis mosellana]|uniref:oxygen-dependent choline dehydrogenase-like n=1 Tax=Sitodiplosis mosellana TaxID=263140 RepID=UPI002444A08F|nr:oxygen-dependent choline dehydrogenase-like [Sitodiplosis mosellana]
MKSLAVSSNWRAPRQKTIPSSDQECIKLGRGSDDYYRCYIRYFVNTCYHPAGTCKMGNFATDPKAVVDNELKVRGIKSLRVIDASIMPNTVSANINAATLMIGEKGADLIKETYAKSTV